MSAHTLADIARLAGVSRTTASYVVNGLAETRRISPTTVARVQAVIEAHDFQVDARAAALRRGQTRTLGLVLPDLENASYARLAKQIERGVREAGYQLVLGDSDDDPASERQLVAALRARRSDALIVASCLAPEDDFYARIVADGTPVIGLDRPLDGRRLRSVASANRGAADALTRSVMQDADGTLLWLDAIANLSITAHRRAGFEQAAAQGRKGMHHGVIRSGTRYDRASGRHLLADYLAHHPVPDAIVTAAYPLLDGALDVLLADGDLAGGVRLPALATFGDHRLLDFLPTPIHTMAQQHRQVAETTLSRLWAALAGDYTPGRDRIDRVLRRRPGH